VNHPRILGIGTANPPVRLTQEQSFHAAGYRGERIRKIFLNSDIVHRHFYLEGALNRKESSDQMNQRYLRGAMKTGCRAILNCVEAAGTTVQDVDFLAVCTCTGLCVRMWAAALSRIWASAAMCFHAPDLTDLHVGTGVLVHPPVPLEDYCSLFSMIELLVGTRNAKTLESGGHALSRTFGGSLRLVLRRRILSV